MIMITVYYIIIISVGKVILNQPRMVYTAYGKFGDGST